MMPRASCRVLCMGSVGRLWSLAGRGRSQPPAHSEPVLWELHSLMVGSLLTQGQEKFWLSFSLVISACRYPSLHWNKEVSQTHTIRGNCVRLTLYPARSFQAWAVFISSSIENRRDVLIGGRMRLLRHFFPSLSTN